MATRPIIVITQEMFDEAKRFEAKTRVARTQASKHDTLTGNLGELAFARYFFGDFQRHRLGQTKGGTDFPKTEIKTSAHPFRETLHLPIRSDYQVRRRPPLYVLVILNVEKINAPPTVGCHAIICGYCSWEEALRHGRERWIATPDGGYNCMFVPMRFLHEMRHFRAAYQEHDSQ